MLFTSVAMGLVSAGTMPRHWLERTSPKWRLFCREPLTESVVLFSRC